MAAVLTLLHTFCLLTGALCGQFQAFLPQTIEVLRGSCVTIPCSFDIEDQYTEDLDNTCKAVWASNNEALFDSSHPHESKINGELTGNLLKKDCTTTLNDMQPQHNRIYSFRVECNNNLKVTFQQQMQILIKDDPQTPTLTPPTLKVKEGTSVSLECSAPAPCLSHPPNLTWTPGLGEAEETLRENQDKTKVKISVLNFTASHLHDGQEISCTAVYSKQDGSTESSVDTSLTADITFAPQILSSSDCTRTVNQVSCSCEAIGNPAPFLQWTLDGFPVNHSDKFATSYDHRNGTNMTFIIMNQTQWKDQFTLCCHSSNSLGSASLPFLFLSLAAKTSAGGQGRVTSAVFIATIVPLLVLVCALLVLICALLYVTRAQKLHHNLPQNSENTNTVVTSQGRPSGEGNEEPIKTNEAIYSNMLKEPEAAQPPTISTTESTNGKNSTDDASESSEKKNKEAKM